MGMFIIQNDFTHGELDPRLYSRTDIELYHKTGKRLRNVVILPQGGARRRFGTVFVDSSTATTAQYNLKAFVYEEGISYVLVFTNLQLKIYKKSTNTLVATLETIWAGADVADLKVTQTFNQMIIVHPSYQPYELSRDEDDATWNLTAITFKIFPSYDFKRNYDAVTFTLGSKVFNITTTLESSSPLFTPDYVGGIFIAQGAGDDFEVQPGVGRIVSYNSTTSVDILINSAFSGTTYVGVNTFLGEPAWSATFGWPRTAAFYEGRLWFGGSQSLPETLFGSASNDYFNFDIGTGQDDDAIQVTLATSSINIIKGLVSSEVLQIFTGSGAFIPPQLDESPLKPTSISVRRQPSNGMTEVDPVILDNRTIYIAKGGKRVLGFEPVADNGVRYVSPDVGIISAHLIRNPVDMAVLQNSDSDDASYLYLVNGDGTLAVYQSLQEQNVSAWTLQDTAGLFKRVAAVEDEIYAIIERTINDVPVTYIERLTFDAYTDSAKKVTFGDPTTHITGLSHLNNQEVRVRADGYVLANQFVIDGEITIERPSIEVEVGLNWVPIIETIPVDVPTPQGPITYIPKRVIRYFIDFYNSLGVYVDGTLIPYLEFGDMVLDEPPEVKSGIYEFKKIGLDGKGWQRRQTCTLTQNDPLDMTILGVGYEIEV